MNAAVVFFGLVATFFIFVAWQCFVADEGKTPVLIFVAFAACMSWAVMSSWQSPEERIQEALKEQAARAAEVTPRKISSADGCTVYTFRPQDRWLYFTKCENAETTTQNTYSVQSGKTTRTETMEIKTK